MADKNFGGRSSPDAGNIDNDDYDEFTSYFNQDPYDQGDQSVHNHASDSNDQPPRVNTRRESPRYPERRATVPVANPTHVDKTSPEYLSTDINFTTSDLPLVGPYTGDKITVALRCLYKADLGYEFNNFWFKGWHERNGFTHVCTRCYAMELPCSHGVPCLACKESDSECYIVHCPFGNECDRLECICMHSDYMTTVENALTAAGRNGSALVKKFFHETHLWSLEPEHYYGSENVSPFAFPPKVSAVNKMLQNKSGPKILDEWAEWTPAPKDLAEFKQNETRKQKNDVDARTRFTSKDLRRLRFRSVTQARQEKIKAALRRYSLLNRTAARLDQGATRVDERENQQSHERPGNMSRSNCQTH